MTQKFLKLLECFNSEIRTSHLVGFKKVNKLSQSKGDGVYKRERVLK